MYRDFTNAKENREKEKDPAARYQKFVKNATKGNTISSGSRSRPKKSKGAVPAWMTQFGDTEVNEDN